MKRKALCSATVVMMLAAPLAAYQTSHTARIANSASRCIDDERAANRCLVSRSGRSSSRRNSENPSDAMLALVADYLRSDGDQRTEARQAWAQFFLWCDATIRRFAATFRSRGVDVDDCTQEVWTDLLTSLPNFKPDPSRGRFTSWLYSIVRSKSLDAVRRQSRRPATVLSPQLAAQIRADDSEPAQMLALMEDRQSVQQGLAKFAETSSERSRTILDMRYRQGQSAAQVAEALGITSQQVWTHEHRAKQKLRELLKNCA